MPFSLYGKSTETAELLPCPNMLRTMSLKSGTSLDKDQGTATFCRISSQCQRYQ